MAISLQRVIRFRSTSCLVLWYGFLERRIKRRYFRFEQIQDGGHRHVGKISSGDISATGRPIHFMFCYNTIQYNIRLLGLDRMQANNTGSRYA